MSNSGTTSFPATLDGFVGLTTLRKEDEAGYTHVALHNQVQAAILTIEPTIGTTSGTNVLKNFVAGDMAARVNNETFGTPTLQNPVIGTVAITSGSANAIAIGTSTIGTSTFNGGTITGAINVPGIGTATDGGTVTFDLAIKQIYTVTLAGNRVLAVSNATISEPFITRLKQGGAGGNTVTWWTTINWKNDTAPTLGTAVSNVDVYGFLPTATNVYDGYVVAEGINEA